MTTRQFGSGSLETVVRNVGTTSMAQCSHWNAIYMSIHWQDCNGKKDWQRSCCKQVGKKYPAVNVSMTPTSSTLFLSVCRRPENGWNRKIASWSYEMNSHSGKCVERHRELAHKSVEHLSTVSTLCMGDHQFTIDDFETVGELVDVLKWKNMLVPRPKGCRD